VLQVFAKQDDTLESDHEVMKQKETKEPGKKSKNRRKADWSGEKSEDRMEDLRNSFTLWHLESEVYEKVREESVRARESKNKTRLIEHEKMSVWLNKTGCVITAANMTSF